MYQTYPQVARQLPFGDLSANQTCLPAPTTLDPQTHMGTSHQGGALEQHRQQAPTFTVSKL